MQPPNKKKTAYEAFKSVWKHRAPEVIGIEIQVLEKLGELQDKYRRYDDLTSREKLDILRAILEDRS